MSHFVKCFLLVILWVVTTSTEVRAYLDIGSGFAVVSSFLAMFVTLLIGVLAVFSWPIRYVVQDDLGSQDIVHDSGHRKNVTQELLRGKQVPTGQRKDGYDR